MAEIMDMDIKMLRLTLIDDLEPYGVTVRELYPFDEELGALVDLPSKQREEQFNTLCEKIKKYYMKTRKVRLAV